MSPKDRDRRDRARANARIRLEGALCLQKATITFGEAPYGTVKIVTNDGRARVGDNLNRVLGKMYKLEIIEPFISPLLENWAVENDVTVTCKDCELEWDGLYTDFQIKTKESKSAWGSWSTLEEAMKLSYICFMDCDGVHPITKSMKNLESITAKSAGEVFPYLCSNHARIEFRNEETLGAGVTIILHPESETAQAAHGFGSFGVALRKLTGYEHYVIPWALEAWAVSNNVTLQCRHEEESEVKTCEVLGPYDEVWIRASSMIVALEALQKDWEGYKRWELELWSKPRPVPSTPEVSWPEVHSLVPQPKTSITLRSLKEIQEEKKRYQQEEAKKRERKELQERLQRAEKEVSRQVEEKRKRDILFSLPRANKVCADVQKRLKPKVKPTPNNTYRDAEVLAELHHLVTPPDPVKWLDRKRRYLASLKATDCSPKDYLTHPFRRWFLIVQKPHPKANEEEAEFRASLCFDNKQIRVAVAKDSATNALIRLVQQHSLVRTILVELGCVLRINDKIIDYEETTEEEASRLTDCDP